MAKKKINDDTLLQLIRDGNSPAEAARRLGVGRAAVSKRLKALKIEVTRDVTLRSAAKLVDRGMDAMAQLQKINDSINAELDWIEEGASGLTGADREKFQAQRLKHVAEIRKQVSIMLDVYRVYSSYGEAKAFRQAVLEAIGECAPEVITSIRQKLREIHAIRSDLDIGIM